MSIIRTMLRQKAVYWAEGAHDDFGSPNAANPVEVKCRWEDKHVEFTDTAGKKKLSNAIVYVDRDLEVGGMLMLGEVNDLTTTSPPSEGVYHIQMFDKTPNLRANQTLRMATL